MKLSSHKYHDFNIFGIFLLVAFVSFSVLYSQVYPNTLSSKVTGDSITGMQIAETSDIKLEWETPTDLLEKPEELTISKPPKKSWWKSFKEWIFGTKTEQSRLDILLNDFPANLKQKVKEFGLVNLVKKGNIGMIIIFDVKNNVANTLELPGDGKNILSILQNPNSLEGNYKIKLKGDKKTLTVKAKVSPTETYGFIQSFKDEESDIYFDSFEIADSSGDIVASGAVRAAKDLTELTETEEPRKALSLIDWIKDLFGGKKEDVEVDFSTKGLCFTDSECTETLTQPVGYVGSAKDDPRDCCALDLQAEVSFCPAGKINARGTGAKKIYSGCDQCVKVSCEKRMLTGPGVGQDGEPTSSVTVSKPITKASEQELETYYCCQPKEVNGIKFPAYSTNIGMKGEKRACDLSFNTKEEAARECPPKLAMGISVTVDQKGSPKVSKAPGLSSNDRFYLDTGGFKGIVRIGSKTIDTNDFNTNQILVCVNKKDQQNQAFNYKGGSSVE